MSFKKLFFICLISSPFIFACTSSEDELCYSFDMRQCNLDPWSTTDATIPVNERIQDYLFSNGISIRKITSEITMEVTCLACSCPSGEEITVTINEADAAKIELLDLLNLTQEACN